MDAGALNLLMPVPIELLNSIDQLDPLPITVQKMIPALKSEDVSLNEIARIIEFDQAIASNILRLANSALYARWFQITSLRDAVMRLGTNIILELVLGQYLKKIITSAPMYDLTEDDLWMHAAVTSLSVNLLIKECPGAGIPPSAPIAGLVHDIGKLIMVRYLKADVYSILKHCNDQKITFVEAEKEIFGFDHAEVGAIVAKKWSFPPEVTLAIEYHHKNPVPDPDPIIDAIVVANLVAKTVGIGLGAEGMNFSIDSACRHRLGLKFETFCRICAATVVSLNDLKAAYGIRT